MRKIIMWFPAIGSIVESVLIFAAYFNIIPEGWNIVVLGLCCLVLIFFGFSVSGVMMERKDLSIKDLFK